MATPIFHIVIRTKDSALHNHISYACTIAKTSILYDMQKFIITRLSISSYLKANNGKILCRVAFVMMDDT